MKNINGRYDQGDIYNRIKAKYPSSIVTQSYLRLEKTLQGTFNTIAFDVLSNQGTANNTERRLQLTDSFVITDLAFFILKAGASTAATQAEIAQAKLRSWANPIVFSAANEAANLQSLYNGYLQLKVNSTTFIDSLDMMSFYRVGTSQQGNGPALALQSDEWPAINNGFKKIVPSITLNGAAKNDIIVQLPNSTTTSGTTSTNIIVCYCRGFLAQNSATLNPNL